MAGIAIDGVDGCSNASDDLIDGGEGDDTRDGVYATVRLLMLTNGANPVEESVFVHVQQT